MPVLLSSRRIPDPSALERLLTIPVQDSVVAVIPNGRDGLREAERGGRIRAALEYVRELGARAAVLDLRLADPTLVEDTLARSRWCWVMGGDPHLLLEAMIGSGFAAQIRQRVSAGYVYAGESAGAIVAGASLRGFDSGDASIPPSSLHQGGLGLVPEVVLPHSDSDDFAGALRRVRAANPGARFLPIEESEQYSLP